MNQPRTPENSEAEVAHETVVEAEDAAARDAAGEDAADPEAAGADGPGENIEGDAPSAEQPAQQSGRRSTVAWSTVAWSVLLSVLILGGGFLALRYSEETGRTDSDGLIAGLQNEIARLSDDLAGFAAGGSDAVSADQLSALQGALEGRVEQLSDRLASLETRLAALADRPAASAGSAGSELGEELDALRAEVQSLRQESAGDGLADRITALQNQIEATNARLDAAAEIGSAAAEALAAVNQRLGAIERRLDAQSDESARHAALLLAVSRLRAEVQRAQPFRQALAAVESIGGESLAMAGAWLETLKTHAARGVPTRAGLESAFAGVIESALDRNPAADGDWWDSAQAEISRIVRIRRVGADAEGDAPDAVLARAEAALEAGDLARAADQLAPLGDSVPAVSNWLREARARLAVDQAIGKLSDAVLDHVAAEADTP